MEISKTKVSDTDNRVKVKTKTTLKIDLAQIPIILSQSGEYIKFIGIISESRIELFSLNDKFRYFLELAANLDFIATSILKGELDRMLLSTPDGNVEEMCYFLTQNNLIFMIYGNIPDKKASWLLSQLKIYVNEQINNQKAENLEKIQLYNLTQTLKKRIQMLLEEYIKLEDVLSTKKLESLDNFLRIDYFGLSFQSIGVLSKILTSNLEITDIPFIDPNTENYEDSVLEMKESMLTAKIEAIAANTVANTGVMPNWISVKLGFQHYRFIIFKQIREYFVSLLAEGNLDLRDRLLLKLDEILNEITKKPFVGDLLGFKQVEKQIVTYYQEAQRNHLI
jgi:hypothetical protein